MLGRSLRRRLPPPALPDVSRLDDRQFLALVLALLLLAAWLGASGLEQLSRQRRGGLAAGLRVAAASPVPYRQPVPAAARLALGGAAPPAGLLAVVRADSLPSAEERDRLCALAAALPAGAARFVALTPDVPPCAAAARRADAAAAAAVRAEIRSARWLLVDSAGRSRYSRRGVPTAADVLETAALLRPAPAGIASAPGRPSALH